MASLEDTMIGLLERGEHPTAAHFGGLERLLAGRGEIAASSFAAEFLSVMVATAATTSQDISQFVAELILGVSDDVALNEIIDTASSVLPLEPQDGRRAFEQLLNLAMDRGRTASFRSAAVRGALLFALGDTRRLAKLAGELSYCSSDDDPFFLGHAVRIAGVIFASEPSGGLREMIEASATVPEVFDQAQFELGLIAFREAVDELDPLHVATKLGVASELFEQAANYRSSRHDAQAFGAAVRVLQMFYAGEGAADLASAAVQVGTAASHFYRYSAREGWAFDMSRCLQVAALTSVSRKIAKLSASLLDPIWLEGARTIEEDLIDAYCANRTVAAGQAHRGLDTILRPRIDHELKSNEKHSAMVHAWLRRYVDGAPPELAPLAAIVSAGLDPQRPFTDAADAEPPFVAIIGRLRSSGEKGAAELASAMEQSLVTSAAHASENIMRILGDIGIRFKDLPDFNGPARDRFLMICLKLLKFLEHRLDATAGQDPTGAYLFYKPDADPPLEKKLQADLLSFLKAGAMPVGDEIRGVGGGRADIEVKIDRHRFIVEVKRELVDATVENLLESYGPQTKSYQATNVKMGFLFVLDLAKAKQGTPDIERCISIHRGDIFSDGVDRGIITLKMPGNRLSPSATKA